MVSLEVLIPIALVTVCIITAMTVSFFTPHTQGDPKIWGVALAALILTIMATLPLFITGSPPKASVDPLGEQGHTHASQSEEPSTIGI
jgi:hypothetical protein